MSDQDEDRLVTLLEAGSDAERPIQVPAEMPVLPLRDTVLFPNSFMPLAVAREASVRLVEEANASARLIGVFAQKDASVEDPAAGRPVPDRHRHAHPQDVQAARRQPSADRSGARARSARSPGADAPVPAGGRHGCRRSAARRGSPRDRRAAAQHQEQLPAGRLALAAAVRRPSGARGQHHRSEQARRLHRVQPGHHRHARQAGDSVDPRRARADGRSEPHPDQGARGPRARVEDSVAGAVRGRQEPARVLSPRAAQGHPEGAGRRGRAGRRKPRSCAPRSTPRACRTP